MTIKYLKETCLYLFVFLLSFQLISCSSTQKIKYFQDIPDSGALKNLAKAEYKEPQIQIDDIINIGFQTLDVKATAALNSGNVPSAASGSSLITVGGSGMNQQVVSGYLVDKAGNVTIPVLGDVHIAGLTTTQARELLTKKALDYFKDITVTVRFVNFKINISGEVVRPGTYIIPNEKVSILDALSLAGDMTIFGKRENVLLIREQADGTKIPYRINLKKSDIFKEPYFYLKQNDYIYVEPASSKVASTDASQARTFAIISSALSVLIVLFSSLRR